MKKREFVTAKICRHINEQQAAGHIKMTEAGAENLEQFLNFMLEQELRDLDFAYWTARTSGVDCELSFPTFLDENFIRF
jgi:hypothetical protein